MKDVTWKKSKGRLESSGCEIQRWIKKSFSFTEYCLPQHSSCAHGSAFSFAIFVGFVCFGHKKVKLYIIAKNLFRQNVLKSHETYQIAQKPMSGSSTFAM